MRQASRHKTPNVEVSGQVTGVRSDAVMLKHPFKAEEDEPERERGTYLNPEAYGQPEERGGRVGALSGDDGKTQGAAGSNWSEGKAAAEIISRVSEPVQPIDPDVALICLIKHHTRADSMRRDQEALKKI